jgi:hypothetical protein
LLAVGGRADAAIGKFDVKPHAGGDGGRRTQWTTFTIANKCEPPGENATIGIGREQLPGAAKPVHAAVMDNPEGAARPVAETDRLFLTSIDTMR